MDDPADGPYSRPPEIGDLAGLCRSLNEAGARYLLIGGFAVILHGYVRGTKDIDLLVDSSDENLRRVKAALSILPDNAVAEIEDGDVRKYQVVRIADEIVVDLLGTACGLDLDQAVRMGVDRIDVLGVVIPVASKDALIRMKDTVRPSDRADVDYLRALLEEERLQRSEKPA